jgi:hypothetical protein
MDATTLAGYKRNKNQGGSAAHGRRLFDARWRVRVKQGGKIARANSGRLSKNVLDTILNKKSNEQS